MPEKLTPEEVAMVIRTRRLLKEKGIAPDTDVKTLCSQAGISRKTGYKWEKRLSDSSKGSEDQLRRVLVQLKAEKEKLKKDYDDVRWENEGRKIAWEIHEVDALLAEKKTLQPGAKRKSGSLSSLREPAGPPGRLGAVCFREHLGGLEQGL